MTVDLLDVVRAERAPLDLATYFDEKAARRYTGRRFESFGGGGDLAAVQDVITAVDLLAVQTLSVVVPAETAFALLDGDLGRQVTALLARVPADLELGTRDAREAVGARSAVLEAWQLLRDREDIGFVTAGKLIARKRPHLIPVYDRVIRCLYGRPQQVWVRLHDRLALEGGELRGELAALRARAEAPPRVSLLRVLDVVLWMRHHDEHREQDCPGFGTVSLERIDPDDAKPSALLERELLEREGLVSDEH
ncbi:DUF6308 family protein [Actinoplanes regularis]|uniref:Uncharacterized protein n=1 Tax=Actinoplanes regularis TaxID=52697 RepID=A0A238W3H5_9ACTN|nr:DUF6308 family protein [Actinoplanes regularis]GIE85303.1 hypothetical protein Are01nite_17830 [Actinoplanes regularis]SNR40957.1 hypothetical protein SAMN06264365_102124 [Actinoplanes regularis]